MASPESVNKNLEVVVIGGGTGNSTVLTGLRPWVGDGLTAIVNTFDDGGGTGKLRDKYDDLPAVGDIRQCLQALSNLEPDQLKLVEHRFDPGNSADDMWLNGQVVGNLLLAAASQQNKGNFGSALGLLSRIYNITGQVLPASYDSRRLKITTIDGLVIEGEHNAEKTLIPSLKGSIVGFDKEPTTISDEARDAIERSDIVVFAPGDPYTSLAPNLVVKGMNEALSRARAVIMVCNLMNRGTHTVGFEALDIAQEYERLIGSRVIDCILYNTQPLDKTLLDAQASKTGSHPVVVNVEALKAAGYKAIGKDLLSTEEVVRSPNDALAESRSEILHDPNKVGHALMAIYFGGFADKRITA